MTERCYPYINPWTRAVGAPEGCGNPLPGCGWTGSVIHPLEHYHDIHPGRGFRQGHPALDFDAPTGTPVRAAATGSVIWAGPNTWGYGNLIILDHGRGFRTLYAHLDTVLAKCGTVVMAGATIGTVGETGQASFEHVHFEVRESRVVDGKVQWWSCDPHRWLGAPEEDKPEEEEMTNLLVNGGFEADWGEEESHRCLVFSESGLVEKSVGNIFTPPGWMTWFRHVPDTWDQPEARDVWEHHDPNRIHSGEKAMLLFTFGRRHDAGFLQVVDVEPGQRLRFTAWGHSWSNHILPGHEGCFEDGGCSCGVGTGPGFWWEDEVPPLNDSHWDNARQNFLLAVGIDPTGGMDPYSDTVIWGRAAYIYNTYAQLTVEATAEMHLATVFLRSTTQWPFKHNDAYWDDADLTVVDGDDDPSPPPPQDCPGLPRIDYERTLVLLPPEADASWAGAVVEGSWDEHRYTISGSADDAGIGALSKRNVLAVNPDEWPGELSLEQFFATYYPGINYTAIVAFTPDELREVLSGPSDPDPPEPPPPYTPLNLINPHMQTAEAGVFAAQRVAGRSPLMQKILSLYYTWRYQRDQAATRQATFSYLRAANSNCCKVFSFEDVYGVLRANPDTIAVVRHPCTNDYGGIFIDDAELGARRWVDMSRDALYATCDYIRQNFPGIKKPFFYLEDPNELYPSHNAQMVTRAANLDQAIAYEVQRTGLEVATVGYCAGVGNPHESEFELLVPLARTLEQTGGAMGLHLYWWGNEHESGLEPWWPYHAGRYQKVDEELVKHGIHVDWLCGESGVVQSDDGHHLNPVSGWRDIMSQERYVGELLTVNQWDNEWNKTHEGRFKLRGIFTSCAPFCNWFPFRMEQQQWEAVAAALK